MIIAIILFLQVTLIATEIDSDYCNLHTQNCDNSINKDNYYLFYDVNPPEGFNLRRDVYMRFAIMLSQAKKRSERSNWHLILPPWHNLYHWRSRPTSPVPWSKFFDLKSLKGYAPVMEMSDVFEKHKESPFLIDTVYVLQNFDDAFEGGAFVEKWKLNNNCKYDGNFWGHKNITVKEVVCVQFQGQISRLWELVLLHRKDRRVMFSHGEIPLHDAYGTKTYWDCRKSMKFSEHLMKVAKKFIVEHFDCNLDRCSNYISVHWRRSDFVHSRYKSLPSIIGAAKQIDATIKSLKKQIINVFIATDASYSEFEELLNELEGRGYNVYSYIPSQEELENFTDGGVAIIDQIICSHAVYFIGTHESTFSYRIQEEREIMGFDSSTTFNRLCPDTGKCEKPSKWTMVN